MGTLIHSLQGMVDRVRAYLQEEVVDQDADRRCLLVVALARYRDREVNLNDLNRRYSLTADASQLKRYYDLSVFLHDQLDTVFEKVDFRKPDNVIESLPEWLVYHNTNQLRRDIIQFATRH